MSYWKTVMIVWSWAREHVLAEAYSKSRFVGKVVVAPGNDFMLISDRVLIEVGARINDVNSILDVAKKYDPYLIDVAQDNALANWMVDILRKNWYNVFWPTKEASRIEWDKDWSRKFMDKYGLPTPKFQYFSKNGINNAKRYAMSLFEICDTVFLKGNELHAWKWVVGIDKDNFEKSFAYFISILNEWEWFLVEQGLVWEEFSFYSMIDGDNYFNFPSAQDNKRVFDNDKWPNTWWMWAHSPASITNWHEEEINDIIKKVIEGMKQEWHPYTGILYLWWIIWDDNKVNIIEFNARWWDPEAQVVIPSLENDYFGLIKDYYLKKQLNLFKPSFSNSKRMCVVWTVDPYPRDIENQKWKIVSWLDDIDENIKLYGSWLIKVWDDFVVNWWRLFSWVSSWEDFLEIRNRILNQLEKLSILWWKLHYRTDVAQREIKK